MIIQAFLHLFFPATCVTCHEALLLHENHLCTACLMKLPYTGSHEQPQEKLIYKFMGKVQVKHVLAYLKFTKKGMVQQIMHSIKYKGNQDLGETLGFWYGNELKNASLNPALEVLLPVPLHPKKMRLRGYNQAACIAKGMATALHIPMLEEILVRRKEKASQTAKKRLERYENMLDVFGIEHPEAIEGKHVAVVDDTLTTGATLEACVQLLKAANPASISIIVLANAE